MSQRALPAAVFMVIASAAHADTLRIPNLSDPDASPQLQLLACDNTGDASNCARTLACVGNDGLWFDGQARGWNEGVIVGQMSDGVVCGGHWAYGGVVNIARATLSCQDGTTARLTYFAQDSLTGTGKAFGFDNRGRRIRAWTGENVLAFLTPEGGTAPELPCTDAPIPIS